MAMDDCLMIMKFKRAVPLVTKWLVKNEDIKYSMKGFEYKGPSSNIERFLIDPDTTDVIEVHEILSGVIHAYGDFHQFFAVVLGFGRLDFKVSEKQERWLDVKMFTDIFNAIEFSESRRLASEKKYNWHIKKFAKKLPF